MSPHQPRASQGYHHIYIYMDTGEYIYVERERDSDSWGPGWDPGPDPGPGVGPGPLGELTWKILDMLQDFFAKGAGVIVWYSYVLDFIVHVHGCIY